MRLYAFVLIAVLSTTVLLQRVYAQPAQKPNVVFILGDDIGYDLLTINGGQSYATPSLDSMAHHGMNFTHCESTPLCNPSRYMLLTGKQNLRNYSNWGYLSDTAKTIGNLMQDAGYKTGFFGKLQLQYSAQRMQNWGWNKYTVFELMDDSIGNYRYKSPNLVDNKGRVPDSIVNGNYCDDILTQRIFSFIDNNKTRPFFVYYSMSLAHPPFCPTPDDPQYAGWEPKKGKNDTTYFPSMIKYMDKKIGEILNKLKTAGLDSNTIVFYAGDNGTPLEIYYNANGQRKRGEKGQRIEGGTHVPLIAYMPGYIAQNSVNDDLINFTDVFTTLADLANNHSNKYGPLDGVSFYKRLFGKQDTARSFMFSHYSPNPGDGPVTRWVRDKVYKLYDTTDPAQYNKFYNIQTDPEEARPLEDNKLTTAEKALKASFRNVLDTTPTWANGPVVNNAAVLQVTNNSVTVSAAIVNSGASTLLERGSTLSTSGSAYYYSNHLPDSVAALGSFSHTRNKLLAQRHYDYSLYAMNVNQSNSTGYAFGNFYTLSNPPLKQPATLTATGSPCSVQVSWGNAGFPKSGATKGGYLLFYSANTIVLNTNANGKAPAKVTTNAKTRMINLQTTLPALPPIATTINGLSPDTLYNFTLVPYTYNGSNNLTYNYLTTGALTTAQQPASCKASLITNAQNSIVTTAAASIMPNPSKTNFTLLINPSFINKQMNIRVCDVAGIVYLSRKISANSSFTFGDDLKPGAYVVYFKAGNKNYQFKIIKE